MLSSVRSTSPRGLASPPTERSPTRRAALARLHSFGTMLEPRYVVGATTLDQ